MTIQLDDVTLGMNGRLVDVVGQGTARLSMVRYLPGALSTAHFCSRATSALQESA